MGTKVTAAGFVLTGGRSSRMGRDKALLECGGETLVERIAHAVEQACGSAVLVGCPERYRRLPFHSIADGQPQQGPLGGIEAALGASEAEWNLVVACDMPSVTVELLASLLDAARECAGNCIVPVSPGGRLQPLCALYRRGSLGTIRALLEGGVRRMSDAIPRLGAVLLPMPSAEAFRNVNTPEEWSDHDSYVNAAQAVSQLQPLAGLG
jgi:molybdopterin-guanine dinucleotide biosynthesis protein A